jgi:hypothetical protein
MQEGLALMWRSSQSAAATTAMLHWRCPQVTTRVQKARHLRLPMRAQVLLACGANHPPTPRACGANHPPAPWLMRHLQKRTGGGVLLRPGHPGALQRHVPGRGGAMARRLILKRLACGATSDFRGSTHDFRNPTAGFWNPTYDFWTSTSDFRGSPGRALAALPPLT